MKKFIALLAAISLSLSFASCGKVREKEMSTNPDVKQDIENKNKEAKEAQDENVPAVTIPEKKAEKETKKDTPSEKKDGQSTASDKNTDNQTNRDIPFTQPDEFFASVAKEFTYESDGGKTVIKLNKDGSFTGSYSSTDTSAKGDKYSNGTKTECHFTGKFSQIFPLDAYTYISVLENYEVKNPSEGEVIKDNTKYVYKEDGGLEDMKEVVFYMPGALTQAISDDFLKCMPGHENFGDTLPDDLYGIFDMNNKRGFYAN